MKKTLVILVLWLGSQTLAADFLVGQKLMKWEDPARARQMTASVWYPAKAGSPTEPIVDKGPFLVMTVASNAPVAQSPSKFPIVLVSHGSGGTGRRMFWLAGYLASKGYVAVAVNHPGNTQGDNGAEGLMRIWDRAKDVSFSLDKLLQMEELKNAVDPKRVSAVGHSAGGATVLMLAGGRFSKARFENPIPKCKGSKDPYFSEFCDKVLALDLKKFSKNEVESSYADPRITKVVSLDPGFVRSFDPKSFQKPTAKMLVVVADKLDTPNDELYSKEFAQLVPKESYEVIPNSVHMTFLSACKPGVDLSDPDISSLCAGNDEKLKMQQRVREETLGFFAKTSIGR